MRASNSAKPAAFYGASFLGLCPGFIAFAPKLDQLHPILACALCGCWIKALQEKRFAYSLAFGVLLMIVCFVSYNLLVLGVFLLLYSVIWLTNNPAVNGRRLVIYTIAALAIVSAAYFSLWAAIGFDPIATFRTAIATQAKLALIFDRPYPQSVVFDLTDFALGTGWISFLLMAFYLVRRFTAEAIRTPEWQFSLIALIQFVTVAVTGLLAAETARVWLFMAPLLMIPVGAELSRWSLSARLTAFACLASLTAVIIQNMTFIQ